MSSIRFNSSSLTSSTYINFAGTNSATGEPVEKKSAVLPAPKDGPTLELAQKMGRELLTADQTKYIKHELPFASGWWFTVYPYTTCGCIEAWRNVDNRKFRLVCRLHRQIQGQPYVRQTDPLQPALASERLRILTLAYYGWEAMVSRFNRRPSG